MTREEQFLVNALMVIVQKDIDTLRNTSEMIMDRNQIHRGGYEALRRSVRSKEALDRIMREIGWDPSWSNPTDKTDV